jgi:hypothetical protein
MIVDITFFPGEIDQDGISVAKKAIIKIGTSEAVNFTAPYKQQLHSERSMRICERLNWSPSKMTDSHPY